MSLLQSKREPTELISVRVPKSVKAQLVELSTIAKAHNLDLSASMASAVTNVIKEMQKEISRYNGKENRE